MSHLNSINYNKFLNRLEVLDELRNISSDFIISGGICDLMYLDSDLIDEYQDIAIQIFNEDLLKQAIDLYYLSYYAHNDAMRIYPSKTELMVVYFHFENKLHTTDIEVKNINGRDYNFFSKLMRRNELDLKLHIKYTQPAINNIDVNDIMRSLFLYSKQ